MSEILDGLASRGDYRDRLAALPAATSDESAAIDLDTVRKGVETDLVLDRLLPVAAKPLPWKLERLGDTEGLWRLPQGNAIYDLLLSRQLGEPISAGTAHAMLSRQVQRLSGQAARLLHAIGLSRGSLGARFRTAMRDERFLYADTDAGRDRAIADMNRTLADMRDRLSAGFSNIPAYCLDVAAERMNALEEGAGKQGYRRLPVPGQPGAYVVDLREIRRRPSWTLPAVVHHELLPGHMLQLPMETAACAHPLRIAYLPAFAEGWGIYAEQWAGNRPASNRDIRTELGQIHWLLFRALRGLIDTGIHHGRWSASKALETLEDVQGEPAYFATFATDIDRVIREPGLRAAEALTWVRLTQLHRSRKGRAERRFHDAILRSGRQRLDRISTVF